jgi:DNA-binding HxlR family transcriptional regulator
MLALMRPDRPATTIPSPALPTTAAELSASCPIARALEIVGERWSLLILREAFLGQRRFNDFERRLGIARNILSARLKHLVERGVLSREPSREDARQIEYRLTPMGKSLFPLLVAMADWGTRWAPCADTALRLQNADSGAPLDAVRVFDRDGVELTPRNLRLEWRPDAAQPTAATD